jgi:hypothetical protein
MIRHLHLVWMAFNRRWVMCIAIWAIIFRVKSCLTHCFVKSIGVGGQHDCDSDHMLTFFQLRRSMFVYPCSTR